MGIGHEPFAERADEKSEGCKKILKSCYLLFPVEVERTQWARKGDWQT